MFTVLIITLFSHYVMGKSVNVPDAQRLTYIPQHNCGYDNVKYKNNQIYFTSNDTVLFYYYAGVSNCAQPNAGTPCSSYLRFTGDFGAKYNNNKLVPYNVWYDFKLIGKQWFVTLRYNYNNGQTSIIDMIPCDKERHKNTLSKCMFDERLYSYKFFNYYQFSFYTTCSYNSKSGLSFKLEQQAKTCTGNRITNINNFVLAEFSNWKAPYESIIIQEDTQEYCKLSDNDDNESSDSNDVVPSSPDYIPACLSCTSTGNNVELETPNTHVMVNVNN